MAVLSTDNFPDQTRLGCKNQLWRLVDQLRSNHAYCNWSVYTKSSSWTSPKFQKNNPNIRSTNHNHRSQHAGMLWQKYLAILIYGLHRNFENEKKSKDRKSGNVPTSATKNATIKSLAFGVLHLVSDFCCLWNDTWTYHTNFLNWDKSISWVMMHDAILEVWDVNDGMVWGMIYWFSWIVC